MGLNGALSVAARSLEIFTAGLQVAGNNIANAHTPGAIRDKLILSPAAPTQRGALIIGNGVIVQGVRQQIDRFLEKRIYVANADFQGAQARSLTYKQLEGALQELTEGDISSAITSLVGRFNDLVNQPENIGNRQIAIQQGVQFAQSIRTLRDRIDTLRTSSNVKVTDLVNEANRLIDEISALNPRITALESAGLLQSDAGSLRTQRLIALNRLSEILPIHTVEHETGGVDVFFGSEHLVLTGDVQHLQMVSTNNRDVIVSNVIIENTNQPVTGSLGELNGTLNGRDVILGDFVDRLDELTNAFIQEFNRVHSNGRGTHGFTSVTGTYAAQSTTAPLNAAGLAYTPQNGSFQVLVTNTITGETTTTNIQVDLDGIGAETTLDSLAAALGAVGNLSASVTSDRKLNLTAGAGYEIQFADDTSFALASLGINTFFTGSNSRTIGVNATVVNNAALLATGRGGGAGDGTNALALAQIFDQPLAELGDMTLEEFYQATISQVAQASASEEALAGGYEGFKDSLMNQRDQFSGISLDEEIVQMLQFQRAFQMSGKFISTIDELFRTLLQI